MPTPRPTLQERPFEPPPARLRDWLRELAEREPELAARIRAGGGPAEPPGRLATGVEAVDRLLGGGLPRGRIAELVGPLSSGRTSLVLALLGTATRAGEVVALVDAADALDPASAVAAGVDLHRLLWVRARDDREALRSAERLLEAHGFGLVVLDRDRRAPGPSSWIRLARAAAASGTALLLLGPERVTGSFSAVALEMAPAHIRFAATPPWLDGIEGRVDVRRSRVGPTDAGSALVQWKVSPRARGLPARSGSSGRGGGAGAA